MNTPDRDILRKILRNNSTYDVLHELAEFSFREYQINREQRDKLFDLVKELQQ